MREFSLPCFTLTPAIYLTGVRTAKEDISNVVCYELSSRSERVVSLRIGIIIGVLISRVFLLASPNYGRSAVQLSGRESRELRWSSLCNDFSSFISLQAAAITRLRLRYTRETLLLSYLVVES